MMDDDERLQLVKSEVDKLPGKKRKGQRYTMVQCPFHSDSTPSGQIRHELSKPRSIGWFQCRGCGESMRWNDFAERTNLETFSSIQPSEKDVPPTHLENLEAQLFSEDDAATEKYDLFTLNAENAAQYLKLQRPVWRTFKLSFLRKVIRAEICYLPEKGRYYVWLPVHVNGKLRGYIKAVPRKYTRADGTPGVSYFNAPGGWSHRYGLFPYDPAVALMKEQGLTTMVLVEGPRDALRLIHLGIPAVAILGTQSWGAKKVSLLEIAGVESVVVMMDGDEAGSKAESLLMTGTRISLTNPEGESVAPPLTALFNARAFSLRHYPNGEDLDPGNAPEEIFDDLRPLLT